VRELEWAARVKGDGQRLWIGPLSSPSAVRAVIDDGYDNPELFQLVVREVGDWESWDEAGERG